MCLFVLSLSLPYFYLCIKHRQIRFQYYSDDYFRLQTCLGSAVPLIYWSITTETRYANLHSRLPPNPNPKEYRWTILICYLWRPAVDSSVLPSSPFPNSIDPIVSFRARRTWPEIPLVQSLGMRLCSVSCIQSNQASRLGASASSTRAATL